MKRYFTVSFGILVFFLTFFLVVSAFHIPLLQDPTQIMLTGKLTAAFLGVGLLIADVVLPAPASLIMVLHGSVFGLWLGSFLSVIGSMGATIAGFWIGRQGREWGQKWIPENEWKRAEQMLENWGWLALLITRSIPLIAETVSILAGASQTLSWKNMVTASFLGIVPGALVYAWTGVYAADVQSGVLSFLFVILVAGLAWALGRYLKK